MNDGQKLDFSLMDGRKTAGDATNPAGDQYQPATLAEGAKEAPAECKTIPAHPDALKSHSRASEGIYPKLEAEKREKEYQAEAAARQAEVYRAYQDAIKSSGRLVTAITNGIRAGEDPARLLLLACEAIGNMTGDGGYYERTRQDIIDVYGVGLMQPVLLELELENIKQRLAMLTRPELDNEPNRQNIDAAITAHRQRATVLETMIVAAGEKSAKGRS